MLKLMEKSRLCITLSEYFRIRYKEQNLLWYRSSQLCCYKTETAASSNEKLPCGTQPQGKHLTIVMLQRCHTFMLKEICYPKPIYILVRVLTCLSKYNGINHKPTAVIFPWNVLLIGYLPLGQDLDVTVCFIELKKNWRILLKEK